MMKYEIHMRQPNRIFLYCSERLGIFFFFALNSSHAHTHPRILNSFFFFIFFLLIYYLFKLKWRSGSTGQSLIKSFMLQRNHNWKQL